MTGTKHFEPPVCYVGYDLWLLREWLEYIPTQRGLKDYHDLADFLHDQFLEYVDTPHVPETIIAIESLHMKEKWDPWIDEIRKLASEIRDEWEDLYNLPEGIPFYHTESLFRDVLKGFRQKRKDPREDDSSFEEFSQCLR